MTSLLNGSTTRLDEFLVKHERILLYSFCVLAMLRIFIFVAAFPFFNTVDESEHFDAVVKYSKGHLPRNDTENYSRESAEYIVLCGSPEYLNRADNFESGRIPSPLRYSDRDALSEHISSTVECWMGMQNHETLSPPIYYALAGCWLNIGKLAGIEGEHLLYWLRFLNLPICALVFWVAFLLCKTVFRENSAMRLSALLLLAFFPQDVFYSINSDVLSPLFCATSLYLLLQIYNTNRSLRFHLLTGITVSAALLVKLSNAPLLAILAVFILLRTRKLLREQLFKKQLPHLLSLITGCALPIVLWISWNLYSQGDITGNAEKVRALGWVEKPLGEIWNHPIFSLNGLLYFLNELLKTFWRGEFVWGLQRVASTTMDSFYIISSYVFVSCSIIHALIAKKTSAPGHRFAIRMCALTLGLFVAFMTALSVRYDFGNCWYPSREYPFFTSGRLILGALAPFLILYADGVGIIVSRIFGKQFNLFPVVLLICIIMTSSEIWITRPVFKSAYNWFHLFF